MDFSRLRVPFMKQGRFGLTSYKDDIAPTPESPVGTKTEHIELAAVETMHDLDVIVGAMLPLQSEDLPGAYPRRACVA